MPAHTPDLAQHLEVVGGAHAEPLRFEQLAVLLELLQALDELGLDALDRFLQPLFVGDVVRRGEQRHRLQLFDDLARERVDRGDALDLVAEERDAQRLLLVRGEDLDRVAAHAELVAREAHVVALVLQLDEPAQDRALVALLPHLEHEELLRVHLGRAEAVDRGDRRDDDDVAAGEERARRRVAQPVDLVVDRAVLLDVRVGRRQVRLGLVVVVVGDEVLDPVLREQLPELGRELRGEALVGRQHERRPVGLRDHVGDRERLPRAGDAEQRLEPVAALDALDERRDRLGLVARGREISDELEIRHSAMVPTKRDRNSQGLSVVRGGLRLAAGGCARGPLEQFLPDRFDLLLRAPRGPRCSRRPRSRSTGGPRRTPAGHPALGVVVRDPPRLEALEPDLPRRFDDDHRVVVQVAPRLDEQRHVVDDDAVRGRGPDLPQELLADRRMRDLLEVALRAPRARTRSRRAGPGRALRPDARMSVPNRSTSLRERGRPRFDHLPGDQVGVDHDRAPLASASRRRSTSPPRSRP